MNESKKPLIQLQGVSKSFGDVHAVKDVNLDIAAGELFAILGGSGSGKTTLLRMLAGFEQLTSGNVYIDGEDMAKSPPYDRPVNMMFQSYAVFPHMNVEKNVAYGLEKDGIPKSEIKQRVVEMLEMVQLSQYAKRRPDQLSGGQLQRVALARALAKRPKVLLLDEPLAALDKKLREETKFQLMDIQHDLGVTFVVLTHDQEEAMTLATRIAVMNQGEFVQIGTPTEIYEYPNSRYVAEFFGTTNIFHGAVSLSNDEQITVNTDECGELSAPQLVDNPAAEGENIMIAVRPEKISIAKEPTGNDIVSGEVWDLGYYGNHTIYRIRLDNESVIQVSAQNQTRAHERSITWEDKVYLSWSSDSSIVLRS
jgi:putrescine transport system ATP-binding protein